ncbi:hypothetical protein VNI00_012583 [Paramarasmius palmivorus]|uniref:Uncharacterized protein n=1 Tax=Paramarasmius palmivorus TaxID=297713 RepID=A0AAW0C446_9AGAR
MSYTKNPVSSTIQQVAYAEALSSAQSKKSAWLRTASHLHQIQVEFDTLRVRLGQQNPISPKYTTFSSERLLALRNAKLNDIQRQWNDDTALDFLLDITGIQRAGHSSNGSLIGDSEVEEEISQTIAKTTVRSSLEKPLPVAAAHHPSQLRKLRKPAFEHTKSQRLKKEVTVSRTIAGDALQMEAQIAFALREALAKSQADGTSLEPKQHYSNIRRKIVLQLREDREFHCINFEVYYSFLVVMLRSYTAAE